MHDDDGLGKTRVTMRSFDHPLTLRELLHTSLDRLFNLMIEKQETAGVVAVTPLDVPEFDGRSIVLALDFDPDEHGYDGLHEPDEDDPHA